jgi:CBS domain containing-hemolysin-like protein
MSLATPTLESWHLLLFVPILLLCEAFFSGSEIALLSADRVALKEREKNGSKRASLAVNLTSHPERVFSTTLLVTSLCITCISGMISLFFMDRIGGKHADWLAILTASPIVVIFGELIPKTIFQRYADRLAPWVAPVVYGVFIAFYPITRVLSIYTTRLSRVVGPIEQLLTGKKPTTRDELRSLMSFNKRETEITTSEKRMIKRILDFKESEAKHALIPLVRVEAIEDSATVREALERFESHRHSRMPVYSERVDNIVGILETTDLFTATDLNQPIRNYVSSAHYVAETQSLEDLLKEMSREDNEMVVVVDEHGGAVGILTFEDIVEEIVGEISDEYDQESKPYREIADGRWLVQARMEIDQINDLLKIELPHGDYETLSGFLLQQFGRIPEPRDELFFNTPVGQLKFTVKQATERHIETVLIEIVE